MEKTNNELEIAKKLLKYNGFSNTISTLDSLAMFIVDLNKLVKTSEDLSKIPKEIESGLLNKLKPTIADVEKLSRKIPVESVYR